MTYEVLIILVLIMANGLFAMSEIAIVSARRARLTRLADRKHRGAELALRLAENPGRFLSTVQVGITLIGTLAGAFGGATLAKELAVVLSPLPYAGEYSETVALAVVVAAISFLSLVLGELAPKQIALSRPERIASISAPAMHQLSRVVAPVASALDWMASLVLRVLLLKRHLEPEVTEDEIRTMIAQGAKSGQFHVLEKEMVDSIFRLGDRMVVELMTPRVKVTWIDLNCPEEALETIRSSPFARFPVARGELDQVAGYIEARDLLGGEVTLARLEKVIRRPLSVPGAFPALRLAELLRSAKTPLALVKGEHGEVKGIVTATDLLEAIVGDLPLPHEEHELRVVRREDGSLLVDGLLSVVELKDLLQVEDLEEGEYNTLGGFVMHHLGKIPAIGEYFDAFGHRFEVVDMDRNRVDRVLISKTDILHIEKSS